VLAHAEDRACGHVFEPAALLSEQLVTISGRETSMQTDFAAAVGQVAQDRRGRRRLGTVGQISGTDGRERGRPAQHEPGREDRGAALVIEQLAYRAANGVVPHGGEAREERATDASQLAFAAELGDAQHGEQGPKRDDIEVVREGRGPSLPIGPRGGERHRAALCTRDHGGAQPRRSLRNHGVGVQFAADQLVLLRRHTAVAIARR